MRIPGGAEADIRCAECGCAESGCAECGCAAGCGCAGTPYQSYTSEMSRCSICIERHCNLLTTLLKNNRDW